MRIDIKTRGFPLTADLRSHAEQRLRIALTCFDDRIQQVAMRLSDVNGPCGGADKRCQLRVVLSGLSDVVIEDIEANLYVAIDRAVDRTGRSVVRAINRRQTLLGQGCPIVSNEPESVAPANKPGTDNKP